MLSWASDRITQLAEQVAEQVAPPTDDPGYRFVASLRRGDEQAALACLQDPAQPLHPHQVVDAKTGAQLIHAAAGHGALAVLRALVGQHGASPELFDQRGATPLHHAAAGTGPGARATVQALVQEFGADPTVRDSGGRTPYDVAAADSVRQYLLPIQLQRETQQAIDAGGHALPPGIDMGGIRVPQKAVAPPPVMVGAAGTAHQFRSAGGPAYAAPPVGGMGDGGGPSPSPAAPPGLAAMMSPPPAHQVASALAPPPGTTPASASASASASAAPPATPSASAFATPHPPVVAAAHTVEAPAPSPAPVPAAASSSGYARRGYSSAAVLPSKAKYMPDGFHSSSSDVGLQAKYGHVAAGVPRSAPSPAGVAGAAVAPPPLSSGTADAASGAGGGFYAGTSASAPGSGAGVGRYPTYDAVTGSVGSAPRSGGGGGGGGGCHRPFVQPLRVLRRRRGPGNG